MDSSQFFETKHFVQLLRYLFVAACVFILIVLPKNLLQGTCILHTNVTCFSKIFFPIIGDRVQKFKLAVISKLLLDVSQSLNDLALLCIYIWMAVYQVD